jgi:hypothetical protein
MLIDVYKSATNSDKYVSLPAGSDASKFKLEQLDPDYHGLILFKKSLNVEATDHRAGFDSAAIIQSIEDHGFAVHHAAVTVTISGG